jgi:NADPH:quinone reductase-like Zn-dependent oxidoreductase
LISRIGSKRIGLNTWEPKKREDWALLAKRLEGGKVVPVIDRRYPLSEVPEALRYLEGGRALDKVVITVRHSNKTQ